MYVLAYVCVYVFVYVLRLSAFVVLLLYTHTLCSLALFPLFKYVFECVCMYAMCLHMCVLVLTLWIFVVLFLFTYVCMSLCKYLWCNPIVWYVQMRK